MTHLKARKLMKLVYELLPFNHQKKKVLSFVKNTIEIKNKNKKKKIQKYVDKYTKIYNDDIDTDIDSNQLPIWQLWLQGEDGAPIIVKRCLDSIKEFNPDREIIVLDESNLENYIELPSFIIEKRERGIISDAIFSDIIRVYLLEKYGGTWIDATVLLTGQIPKDILNCKFFAPYTPKEYINSEFHIFSNWFMHAQPNHVFIKSLKYSLSEYWKQENQLIDYFLFHYIAYNTIHSSKAYMQKWEESPKISIRTTNLLLRNWNLKYSEDLWNEIISTTSIHKLTYKFSVVKKDTILDYIIN